MKTELEIKNRIRTLEGNLKLLKDEYGKMNVKFMISELKWVVGGEGN